MSDNNEENNREAKRQKTSSFLEDHLICPITLQLPEDPVVAEDGRIYDRKAIEDYFQTNSSWNLILDRFEVKSPVTKNIIGAPDDLVPCLPVKKMIESLASLDITGRDIIAGSLAVSLLTCPITWNLPVEPVVAEDGLIYERSQIQKYFDTNPNPEMSEIESPVTKKLMNKNMVACLPVLNIIETLVEAGGITGDLAQTWKEKKAEQKEELEDLIDKAGGDVHEPSFFQILYESEEVDPGDEKAMWGVGRYYSTGTHGFPRDDEPLHKWYQDYCVGFPTDHKEAYKWFQRAHKEGYVPATFDMAYMELNGLGVAKNMEEGLLNLGLAAGQGSDRAAYHLAIWKMDQDKKEETLYWLDMATDGNCQYKTMSEQLRNERGDEASEYRRRPSY